MIDKSGPTRPALRWFGGKWRLAPWILSNLPEHRIYVEPFGGAASVLIRKRRTYAEVYNDLDGEVVSFFRVLQDKGSALELERRLRLTPFAREEFYKAYEDTDCPVESARRLVVRSFMGFGADGHNKTNGRTGFRAASNRSGTTPANDWVNFPGQIQAFYERMCGVVLENRDALEVMAQQDTPETLHFVDPPYVHETRGCKKAYKFEMNDDSHKTLVTFLKGLQGMVVLCGYHSEVYDGIGWQFVEKSALADGARKRTEVLWFNDRAWERRSQSSLLIA